MSSDLGRRIDFTVGILLVFRLGTSITIPGIDPAVWQQLFRQQAGGILGMFDTFAGGAIGRSVPFCRGGTSLLILVCAILDLRAQFGQVRQDDRLEAS